MWYTTTYTCTCTYILYMYTLYMYIYIYMYITYVLCKHVVILCWESSFYSVYKMQVLLAFGPGSPVKGGKENQPVKVIYMYMYMHILCIYKYMYIYMYIQVYITCTYSIYTCTYVYIVHYINMYDIQMPDYLPENTGDEKTDDKVCCVITLSFCSIHIIYILYSTTLFSIKDTQCIIFYTDV